MTDETTGSPGGDPVDPLEGPTTPRPGSTDPDNDVVPAAAAGLAAIHVRRGPWGRLQRTPPEAALGLDDLASLPDALASLR